MFKNTFFPIIIGLVLILISCGNGASSTKYPERSIKSDEHGPEIIKNESLTADLSQQPIKVGANRTENYLKLLKGKRVGFVGNQSSVIFKDSKRKNDKDAAYTHLVDSLLSLNIDVKKVFSPEHGFRGTADAGEEIKDGLDPKTRLPIISLYGDNKKPKPAQLEGLDIMVFDIQDVGVRFYTYISTLHYVMEACAEAKIPLLILDKPNPNGHYIDGPILEKAHTSFVGMHPIPIAHGMTIAEYAQMINGEKWLKNGIQCDLTVISMENYTHDLPYSLPIKPSPNLPNDQSIALYPSLCFFEGTNVSVGRGTDTQFQVFGSPDLDKNHFDYRFTPQSKPGATAPPQLGKMCYGRDLTQAVVKPGINLVYVIDAYAHSNNKTKFFNSFFVKLAGTSQLQKQIEQGLSEKEIKATWAKGLQEFKDVRKRYTLYP
ncbi:exo-beta-N-acetylmuramidase NamZ family protein [Gelidibacter salicanalis]